MKNSSLANRHSLDVNGTDCFSHANFIPSTISEGPKNDVGCRDDTVPKTVDTRMPCKVRLECATILYPYTLQCTVHPYEMGPV